jgi:hypothetical protein
MNRAALREDEEKEEAAAMEVTLMSALATRILALVFDYRFTLSPLGQETDMSSLSTQIIILRSCLLRTG